MKYSFTVLFTLLLGIVSGQKAEIKEIRQTHRRIAYVFPNVIVEHSVIATKKINNTLRMDMLEADSATPEKKIFRAVWGVKDEPPMMSDISYKVTMNDHWKLSLTIQFEGCGAYCETYNRYFNFNLKTGNKLILDSIFTDKGLNVLRDSINLFRAGKIKAVIKEAQAALKTKAVQKDQDEKERYAETLDLFKECLTRNIDREYLSELEFVLSEKTLTAYSGRCSAHVDRALDEIGNFEYVISLKDWSKYLTPYGILILTQ